MAKRKNMRRKSYKKKNTLGRKTLRRNPKNVRKITKRNKYIGGAGCDKSAGPASTTCEQIEDGTYVSPALLEEIFSNHEVIGDKVNVEDLISIVKSFKLLGPVLDRHPHLQHPMGVMNSFINRTTDKDFSPENCTTYLNVLNEV